MKHARFSARRPKCISKPRRPARSPPGGRDTNILEGVLSMILYSIYFAIGIVIAVISGVAGLIGPANKITEEGDSLSLNSIFVGLPLILLGKTILLEHTQCLYLIFIYWIVISAFFVCLSLRQVVTEMKWDISESMVFCVIFLTILAQLLRGAIFTLFQIIAVIYLASIAVNNIAHYLIKKNM